MTKYISHFLIKIDGQDMSETFMDALEEVVVDTSLHLPGMFVIRVNDPDLDWIDSASLDIGKEVEISVQCDEEQGSSTTPTSLIKGEITALEPHFSSGGRTTMAVRGYDKSHRLHRGRKTRTFQQKKDSDLASTIAGEAGLGCDADTTTVIYDYVLQNNQTNMEFLLSRAERIGYQVYVADGKLYFKKGDYKPAGQPAELVYTEDLISFQPCWTARHQADKITVKSWDPKAKTAISSQKSPSSSLNQGGMTQTGGAKTSSAFSSAEEVLADKPVFTTAEADELATGLSHDVSRDFVLAEGLCEGDPNVNAGKEVKITGIGTRFSGNYYVTSATHEYRAQRYETRFTISGRRPNTIGNLLGTDNDYDRSRGLVNGVVTALVTNLNDPDELGRVKVKYAWLGEIESFWVRIAAPMAGSMRGFQYLPEINDEVLIAFEHGDVHRPYIIGALWSSTDKPPKKNSEAVVGGKVNQRVIKTRQGHLIILDDKQGEEQISVQSKSGHKVILDDKAGSEKISVIDKTGNNSMVINSVNNSMTINVAGDFSVTAKGKVTIKSTMDMTLESMAMSNIKSAANMTVKAGANLSLQATAMGELKGNMVTVDGGPMTIVKGALVKIN